LQRGIDPLIAPLAMLRAVHATRSGTALPLFTPASLARGQPEAAVETTALYAGESVARIHSLEHAYDVTRRLGSASS
jgi:hypothetical protein